MPPPFGEAVAALVRGDCGKTNLLIVCQTTENSGSKRKRYPVVRCREACGDFHQPKLSQRRRSVESFLLSSGLFPGCPAMKTSTSRRLLSGLVAFILGCHLIWTAFVGLETRSLMKSFVEMVERNTSLHAKWIVVRMNLSSRIPVGVCSEKLLSSHSSHFPIGKLSSSFPAMHL